MNKLIRILFLVLLLSALRYPLSATYATIPHLINYQGRLTDTSGAPLTGSQNITFSIYDTENAGTLLWQGTYNNVPFTKGTFNILLGDINDTGYNFQNLAFDKPYWLEIKVGTDNPMTPRQRITSAGYAITAENGVPHGVVVMWSGRIADIPNGWALCDGSNGTLDLRDKFIVGARQDDSGISKTNISGLLTQVGGSINHTHTGNTTSDISGRQRGWSASPIDLSSQEDASKGKHYHSFTTDATNHLPPYYALAYIMKI